MFSKKEILMCLASEIHEEAKSYAISKMDDNDFIKLSDSVQSNDNSIKSHNQVAVYKVIDGLNCLCTVKQSKMWSKFEKLYEEKLMQLLRNIVT